MPSLSSVRALAEAAFHGGDVEGIGVPWVNQYRPHDPRFVAQGLPASACVRAPVDAMVNHVGVEGVWVVGVHAQPVHVCIGKTRVVPVKVLAAVLRAVEAVVAANIHLGWVARVYDPTHRVSAFYARRLCPGLPAVIANRATLVTTDHNPVGVVWVYRQRVQVASHEGPLDRASSPIARTVG